MRGAENIVEIIFNNFDVTTLTLSMVWNLLIVGESCLTVKLFLITL